MRIPSGLSGLAGLLSLSSRQTWEPDSHAYVDAETGLKFAAFNSDRGIAFRVALPTVEAGKEFDTILQIAAPIDIGWVGFAWGGTMTYNPLAILWANGTSNPVISSRIAYGYYTPPEYEPAKYTVLKTGTHMNATHFQLTALCKGCSKWGDEEIGYTELEALAEETTFGFAYGNHPVDTPSSIDSTFAIHDSIGHPVYNLAVAMNADFETKVASL
jgi:hypothetical protein